MPTTAMPAGSRRRRSAPAGLLIAVLVAALAGCTPPGWLGGDGAAGGPCKLVTGSELAALVARSLHADARISSQQEADVDKGRMCQYSMVLRTPDGQDDAGLELQVYDEDAEAKLNFYRGLTSDSRQVDGLGGAAWWSARNDQLLVLRGDKLVLAHLQLPSVYRGRDRDLAVSVGAKAVARL